MKLAVVGSRTFRSYALLEKTLDRFENIELIVSGGAEGADTLAEQYALNRKIPMKIHWPDWQRYGRSAGHIRNELIVDDCDEVVAFWDGESRGTLGSISFAKRQNKPVTIAWED